MAYSTELFFATDNSGGQIKNPSGIPLTERGTQVSPLIYTPQRDANGLPLTTGTVVLRKVIGDPNPDYTASLVNEVGFNRFNLRVQLDAVQGVDYRSGDSLVFPFR